MFGEPGWKRVARSFSLAAGVSAVLFATFTFITDRSGLQSPSYAIVLLCIGMAASLFSIVVLGLPMLFFLMRLRLVNLWSTIASGLVIGAVMAGLTEWPQSGLDAFKSAGWDDHSVRRMCVLALIGAVAALCFWLSLGWRCANRSEN